MNKKLKRIEYSVLVSGYVQIESDTEITEDDLLDYLDFGDSHGEYEVVNFHNNSDGE